MRHLLIGFLGLLMGCSAVVSHAQTLTASKTLEAIQRRGAIHIGVKTDFFPFGALNAAGEPEGFEVDLAADLAAQLNVKLVPISVTTENRFAKLEQGVVDVVLATVADTAERRQVATAIEPSYYAGGVGVLLRPEQHISEWAAMRGQKLCATQGAYFNRPMSQRYLLDLEMYKSIRDAQAALRDGRCIGFLYSSSAIQSYLLKSEWAGYQAPLPQALLARWAIMLPRKDKGTDFERWVGDRVATWHKEGRMIALERKWRLPPSKFLVDEKALLATCVREPSGNWPAECRNPTFVRADEVGGLYGLGLWINENLGVNLTVLYDDYDRALFGRGLLYSLLVMAGAIAASLVFGFLGALLVQSHNTWVRRVAEGIAVYGRMTPPLLTMYLLFFGLGGLLATHYGIKLSAIGVAIVCLSFYTGSLMMNCIVDAMHHLKHLDKHFILGLSNVTEILSISSRPLKLILINVVKQSVICSALAVPELIFATTSIVADHGNPNVMMNIFVVVFLIIITVWLKIFDKLEDQLHRLKKHHAKKSDA